MAVSLVSFFLFHRTALLEYKQLSDNLILENLLSQRVDTLVETYNAVVIAPGSSERKDTYQSNRNEILTVFQTLDTSVQSKESKTAYSGLKRIILSIVEDCDNGMAALNSGDPTTALNYYNDALYKQGFVTDNTTAFLLMEIEHLHEIRSKTEARYAQQLWVIGVWTVVLVFIAVLYSFIFARRITSPIKILSSISRKVARGDLQQQMSKELLDRRDEVGSLSRSFGAMLENLNAKITQVETANKTILETKQNLEERNEELERFNHMVIGRELKMVALKEENARLKELVEQKSQL